MTGLGALSEFREKGKCYNPTRVTIQAATLQIYLKRVYGQIGSRTFFLAVGNVGLLSFCHIFLSLEVFFNK